MGGGDSRLIARRERIRSALLVVCALILFVAGLLLLFAPASAHEQSRRGVQSFPVGPDRWIMGAQSREPVSLRGANGCLHFLRASPEGTASEPKG